MSAFDGFGDVIQKEAGIFAGSRGHADQDRVSHDWQADGLLVEVDCEHCGRARHVTVSYPEIIALKYNVSPHEAFASQPQLQPFASPWRTPTQQAMQKGVHYAWMPAGLRCGRCGGAFERPHISPAECEGLLAGARQRGFLNPAQEKPLADWCFNVARQLGRR